MRTIYKYPVVVGKNRLSMMPSNAEWLHFARQGAAFYVWARVDTDSEPCQQSIDVVGTGWADVDGQYIGTLQDGSFVWHAFDTGKEPIA